jgi:putative spermidine/putrescine transport system ATP-binding protein
MTGGRFDHLRLDGVCRRFGGRLALDSLDLQIAGGEFVALLGPSGCGKSTALNCIAGLLPLSDGRIWLDQRRIDVLPPERRGFGMVFQNYALFPHLSVRGNVGFGLRMRGVNRAETRRRVHQALSLVQLTEYADRLPGQLSGGQQQRVAIARAIVIEPPLVLMDEPLSNLDAALRLEMRTEIRRLHQELGLTTIYVTHDQEEALSLADRLVVLREGVVQQVGTPEELYRAPANAYVAGFMGYRNLFPATVTAVHGETATVSGAGLELVGLARGAVDGSSAIVAIRPEDFSMVDTDTAERVGSGRLTADSAPLRPLAAQGANTLRVDVEVVEYHGREQAVLARLPGGLPLRVRTVARLAPGDQVTVRVPIEQVLVFAADTAAARAAADLPEFTVPPSGLGDLDGPPAGVAAGPPAGAADNRTAAP